MPRAHHAAAACIAIASFVGTARAEPTGADGRAQALFDRGLALMDKGDFEAACPLLAESEALEPVGGTVLNLSYCLERTGKLVAAARGYDDAERIARSEGRAEREAQAHARRERVLARTPRVRIRTSEPLGPEAFRLDGEPVVTDPKAERRGELVVLVDPGTHVLEVEPRSNATASRRFDAAEGETIAIGFDERDLSAAPVPAASPAAVDRTPAPPTARSGRQRTIAITVGAGGVAATGAAVVLGLLAAGEHDESRRLCPGGECVGGGIEAERDANRLAWGSNVALGVGVVALGVATVLWLTAPTARATSAWGVHF